MPGDAPECRPRLTQPLKSLVAPNLQSVWPAAAKQHMYICQICLASGRTQAQSVNAVFIGVLNKTKIGVYQDQRITFTFFANQWLATWCALLANEQVGKLQKAGEGIVAGDQMDELGQHTIQNRRNRRQRWICSPASGQPNNSTWPMAVASKPV